MFKNQILDNPKFWSILQYLVDLNSPQSFSSIQDFFKITPNMLTSLLNFLNEVDYKIETKLVNDEIQIYPPQIKPKFVLHFNLLEWLSFQAHFPVFDSVKGSEFHKKFIQKLTMIEDEFKQSDLFAPLSILEAVKDHSLIPSLQEVKEKRPIDHFIEQIEWAILNEKCMKIFMKNNTQLNLLPRRLVYLDKFLCLIGEDAKDSSLTQFSLWNIVDIENSDREYSKSHSKKQIDDFISSLKCINENEIRLVLKIYDHHLLNLEPNHIHLVNPCLVTNGQGDKIWAATIEPCDELFEWIFHMGKSVEIIDPEFFKKQYLEFCVNKLKLTG